MTDILLYQTLAYAIWKNIKKSYKNNKLKISARTWNDKFGLLDGSFLSDVLKTTLSMSFKKHETMTYSPPVRVYVNKM